MSTELLCKFPDNGAVDFDYSQSSIGSPLVSSRLFPPVVSFQLGDGHGNGLSLTMPPIELGPSTQRKRKLSFDDEKEKGLLLENNNIGTLINKKLGVMIDQRDLFRQRIEEQKKKVQDTEVAAAKRLEEAKEATKEATKARMMDLINSMGRELVDSGYLLCRKRIQKLYPDLDISRLDDVEVESLPSSPNPPDVEGFVEVIPPISSIPPKTK
ncbi:hypothetical protein F0562_003916 [Nyssa sinensis]|uniref:No apical meristem-associated C-terminal domain-containing protein n=1 Tax=Nyssa sinensis TaxID=561372 RepID=A0A5J5C0P0_9ASTE|nr:hypothetical protein F0562_003916 [Nyssa sinensis]